MNLIGDHTPLHAKYEDETVIICVTKYNEYLYININSLCQKSCTTEKWKRNKPILDLISKFDEQYKPIEARITIKNTSSWLVYDLFENFGNWLGPQINKPNFGTIIAPQLISLYEHRNYIPDPYFCRIDDVHILRRERTGKHRINITDISNMLNVDVRNWKKTVSYEQLILKDPECVDSASKSVDEFGIRTSYGTIEAALNIITYSKNTKLKDSILEFVNNPLFKSTTKSTKPSTKPTIIPVTNSTAKSTKPVVKNVIKPIIKPATKPIIKPATNSTKFNNKINIENNYKSENNDEDNEDDEDDKEEDENNYISEDEEDISHNSNQVTDIFNSTIKLTGQIYKCSLVLNDKIVPIEMRTDGYIDATKLCEAGNKRIFNYIRNDTTQAYIKALERKTHIRGEELIMIQPSSNGKRHTWVHMKVAIHLAQWISPEFAVQVTDWIEELIITNSVTLGKEKTNEEIQEIYSEKVGFDIRPYYTKDVLYTGRFNDKSLDSVIPIGSALYKFGVTSNIKERVKSYSTDKKYLDFRIVHIAVATSRHTASELELYVKDLAKQMGLKLNYKNRNECYTATEEQLKEVIGHVNEFVKTMAVDLESRKLNLEEHKLNLEEHKINFEKHKLDTLIRLFEEGKLTADQLQNCLK